MPALTLPKSTTTTRKHHRTTLRCALPAVSKTKLSKNRTLVTFEGARIKVKCVAAAKKKTHKHHRQAKNQSDAAHLTGGAAKTVATPATGSDVVQANPAVASVWSRLSTLLARGDRPPSFLIPIYKAAGRRYHVPWAVLAAINAVETNYGRNLNVSSAGAMGWMQFMPETWLQYGVVIGRHDAPNPYDPRDAIFSAARYLAANGARHHLRRAIFAYNHAKWYVDEVLWTAATILDHTPARGSRARVKLDAMRAMALALDGLPYIWSGGHGGWEMANGYDCSGFVSTVLHAAGYLAEPVTTQALPDQRHILQGPGRYVTIFDRTDGGALTQDHVIIDLNGQWWESGGTSGAGVHKIKHIKASYLLTFNQILHPRGL
jgi:membrane-bound lytic murein transglycosylase B